VHPEILCRKHYRRLSTGSVHLPKMVTILAQSGAARDVRYDPCLKAPKHLPPERTVA
jgi:hypothetical protein